MAIWSAFLARPARPSPVARPSKTLFFLLAGAFILTLVPFAIQFPSWLSIAIVVAMVARCVLEAYRLPLPSTTFTTILALILLGLVVLQYGHFIGRDFGTALTAGLLAIKFYELRRPRDVSLIIFSCFFVVMSALLYSQVLELFIYCLIMMWVLTALLTRVQTGDQPDDFLLQMLKKSGIIFLQALPLALFLFFFFPRYPGPIGIHLDEATIGISDVVAPGSIADLAMNDSEAMYVQFPPGSSVPTTDTMYWRALVLWNYENGIWTQGRPPGTPPRSNPKTVPSRARWNRKSPSWPTTKDGSSRSTVPPRCRWTRKNPFRGPTRSRAMSCSSAITSTTWPGTTSSRTPSLHPRKPWAETSSLRGFICPTIPRTASTRR